MKAHATLDPTSGHFIPLGQYTSPPRAVCSLMLDREHGKQNLCADCDGHCTKCVSSSLPRHSAQFKGVMGAAPGAPGKGMLEVGVFGTVAACFGLVLLGCPPTPLPLLLVLLEVRARLSE